MDSSKIAVSYTHLHAVVGGNGRHVVHALHAGNLAFQGSAHGIRHRLRAGPRKHGLKLDGARRDFRILGNRQVEHADQPQQRGHNGNHGCDCGMLDEKRTHGLFGSYGRSGGNRGGIDEGNGDNRPEPFRGSMFPHQAVRLGILGGHHSDVYKRQEL